MSAQPLRRPGRGLRLLSIDGGGIRGLSALLILKEILYRIQHVRNLQNIPRVCDVFDLAGGTGTGGIIVTMLFRLQMPIDDAINAYLYLSKYVFSNPKTWPRQDGILFEASRLEDALIKIIQTTLGIGDQARGLRMLDDQGPKCFVCAISQRNTAYPVFFRSWKPPANQTCKCTIVEACRATTADVPVFTAVEIGDLWLKETFIGGSLRCNNPVKFVLQEAQSAFPNRIISCVLSIGAGMRHVIELKGLNNNDTSHLSNLFQRIATDCESASEDMAKQLSDRVYFRLNVDRGLQGVGITQWEEMSTVLAHTLQYLRLHDIDHKIARLVQVLVGSSGSPPSTLSKAEDRAFQGLKNSIAVSAYYDSEERSMSTECLAGTRKRQIKTVMDWIEANEEMKPLFVVLGPAGSGKSSLLRTIARICKEKKCLAASFFFSGTDSARNTAKNLMNTIAYQIAEVIPELRPYVARSVHAEPTIFSRSLESQTQQLLLEPLGLLRSDYPAFPSGRCPHVVVIDALDECLELEDQLRVISQLANVLVHKSFPFLCLLSSRYNVHIENELANVLAPRMYRQLSLGTDQESERVDISVYLRANIDYIRDRHPFGKRIPQRWPLESDLDTIVKKSGGQFIYASTVIKYVGSPKQNPHERLRHILGTSCSRSGEDPFAELDVLYRALMSSVENLTAATETLGIYLVKSSPKFWIPTTLRHRFDFKGHFRSLDADIALAPLTSVLKYEDGRIDLYHLSFAGFLLDCARSGKYFVNPEKWQKWIISQLVPFFYDRGWIVTDDVVYLVTEATPGTELHRAINNSLSLVANDPKLLPSGGVFNIWPLVTYAFFEQLQFTISIDKMAGVFVQQGEDFLALSILVRNSSEFTLSNSFLLFEMCRTCDGLRKAGYITQSRSLLPRTHAIHQSLLLFMPYLADHLENQRRMYQKVLLPDSYLSATLRCLWYIQSPSHIIRSALKAQFSMNHCQRSSFSSTFSLYDLPCALGIYGYLSDASSDLSHGALDALPILLARAPPSVNLLATLKRPFNNEVISRTPSASHRAMTSIHKYLMQHDPEYQEGKHTTLFVGHSEPGEDLVDCVMFLHQTENEIPRWVDIDAIELLPSNSHRILDDENPPMSLSDGSNGIRPSRQTRSDPLFRTWVSLVDQKRTKT